MNIDVFTQKQVKQRNKAIEVGITAKFVLTEN